MGSTRSQPASASGDRPTTLASQADSSLSSGWASAEEGRLDWDFVGGKRSLKRRRYSEWWAWSAKAAWETWINLLGGVNDRYDRLDEEGGVGTHSEAWAQIRSNASRWRLISSGSGWGTLWGPVWWMLP